MHPPGCRFVSYEGICLTPSVWSFWGKKHLKRKKSKISAKVFINSHVVGQFGKNLLLVNVQINVVRFTEQEARLRQSRPNPHFADKIS